LYFFILSNSLSIDIHSIELALLEPLFIGVGESLNCQLTAKMTGRIKKWKQNATAGNLLVLSYI